MPEKLYSLFERHDIWLKEKDLLLVIKDQAQLTEAPVAYNQMAYWYDGLTVLWCIEQQVNENKKENGSNHF